MLFCLLNRYACPAFACNNHQELKASAITRRSVSAKSSKAPIELSTDEKPKNDVSRKEGTVVGAVALIIGTSIGSGILALPKKASAAVKIFSVSLSHYILEHSFLYPVNLLLASSILVPLNYIHVFYLNFWLLLKDN